MLPKTGNVQWPKFHVKKAPFYAGYAAEVQYATRITITTPQSVKLAALRSFTMLRTGVGTPRFFFQRFFHTFPAFQRCLTPFESALGSTCYSLYFCIFAVMAFILQPQCSAAYCSTVQRRSCSTVQHSTGAVQLGTIQYRSSTVVMNVYLWVHLKANFVGTHKRTRIPRVMARSWCQKGHFT